VKKVFNSQLIYAKKAINDDDDEKAMTLKISRISLQRDKTWFQFFTRFSSSTIRIRIINETIYDFEIADLPIRAFIEYRICRPTSAKGSKQRTYIFRSRSVDIINSYVRRIYVQFMQTPLGGARFISFRSTPRDYNLRPLPVARNTISKRLVLKLAK